MPRCGWRRSPHSWQNFAAAAIDLGAGLAFQLSLVAQVLSRGLDDLRRASRRDALTGLLNRRALDDLMAAEARLARRFGCGFSVPMIDIDHFKRINDSEGHAAGDRALQHLAGVMLATLRDTDHLARWGGEEFVALLPGTGGDDARTLAERLRERVSALPLVWKQTPLAITVSIGHAGWRGEADTPAELLRRADDALYRAKQAGRDRVHP